MKKLIIAILILLPSFAFAGMQDAHKAVIARMNVASGECSWTTVDSNSSSNDSMALGYNSSYIYTGGSFTASDNYSAKRISVWLAKVGDPNAQGFTTITAYIATDSGGSPDVLTAADATLSTSSLTINEAEYQFEFSSGYTITSGVDYWIIVKANAAGNSSNRAKTYYLNTGTQATTLGDATPTWSNHDSSSYIKYKVDKCD